MNQRPKQCVITSVCSIMKLQWWIKAESAHMQDDDMEV